MASRELILSGTLVAVLAAMAAALILWWLRERRMAEQRNAMRALHTLAEEIISAASAGEIVERLRAALPKVLEVTGVRVFLHDRGERALSLVAASPADRRLTIPLESGPDSGATLAYRNCTLLAIPDLRRSPVQPAPGSDAPVRAVMYVPMVRNREAAGILEVSHDSLPREFSADERAAAQHLANQVAAALGLLEQQSVREQVLRSERLAASGELISGVANELRVPLEAISDLASRGLDIPAAAACEQEIQAIAREAGRAGEIVDRLVSFSHADGEPPRPLDLIELLRNLIDFREREWVTRGIELRNLLPDKPAPVLGIEGQLEQVFLSLLVHAEQSVAGQPDKTVSIEAGVSHGKVVVEISYPRVPEGSVTEPAGDARAGEEGTLGLAVCLGVLRSCGGDIRFHGAGPLSRFEVMLPLAAANGTEETTPNESRAPLLPLTLAVVEPDIAVSRQLLLMLAERRHRAVLLPGGQEAVAMVDRFRFDALFCSVRLPGMNWVEVFDRVRGRVRTFVLMTNGYDPDLTREAGEKNCLVLNKPVSGDRLDHTLAAISARTVVE